MVISDDTYIKSKKHITKKIYIILLDIYKDIFQNTLLGEKPNVQDYITYLTNKINED